MGQHDDNIKNSHGTTNALPPYYVCSPSAPPFIPRSPMKTSPSHYPHLYHETYPQMAHMLPSGAPVYSGDFLKPPPMSFDVMRHFVLTVDGDKVPVDAQSTTKTTTQKDTNSNKYPWWSVFLTFTLWISVAQVAVFIVSVVKGGFASFDSNINMGPPTATLVQMGAKVAFLMRYESEGWRFASAMFVHAGILHIVINLAAQVRLGVMLEREWGRMKFLAIYLVSGVASTLMSCLIEPGSVSVGASGAILGTVGAYFAYIILIWRMLSRKEKQTQIVQACFMLLVLGLLSLAPFIDSSAHLGGLLIGFLLGFTLLPNMEHPIIARKIRVVPALMAAAFFAIGFWYFYSVEKPQVFSY